MSSKNILCSDISGCSTNSIGTGNFPDYNTNLSKFGGTSSYYYLGVIKFHTPLTAFKCTQVRMSFWGNQESYATGSVRYALCTSDGNYSLYENTWGNVDDPNQIVSGLFQISGVNGDNDLIIQTNEIKPDSTYYLFLWAGGYKSMSGYVSFGDKQTSDVVLIELTCAGAATNSLNGFERTSCICVIDNGNAYIYATPYICIYKTEDWDGIFQGTVTGSLNLRNGPGTSYSIITSMPDKTQLTAYEIDKGDNGSVWAHVKYNSNDGWCNTNYLTYSTYVRVTNPNGAKMYTYNGSIAEATGVLPYGKELIVARGGEYSYGFFIESSVNSTEEIIYGEAILEHDDGTKETVCIMMSDAEILSERSYCVWEPCTPFVYIKEPLFSANMTAQIVLYETPSSDSGQLTEIPKGITVPVMELYGDSESSDPWFSVKYENYSGWIDSWRTTYSTYARVVNPNGAQYYNMYSEIIDCTPMPYGEEIYVSNGTNKLFVDAGVPMIQLYDAVDDNEGNSWIALIKADDVEFLNQGTADA